MKNNIQINAKSTEISPSFSPIWPRENHEVDDREGKSNWRVKASIRQRVAHTEITIRRAAITHSCNDSTKWNTTSSKRQTVRERNWKNVRAKKRSDVSGPRPTDVVCRQIAIRLFFFFLFDNCSPNLRWRYVLYL